MLRALLILAMFAAAAVAQNPCACGSAPPRPLTSRQMEPYAGTPEDLRPFGKFRRPYHEHYTGLVEYNGPAREAPIPPLSEIDEVRIGFLGPVENHPDEALGKQMLSGAMLAVEEANAAGGYCGKPFRLLVHNDQATWGSSSNEVVKMVYDDKVWAIFGSISGDSTHIALRVALRAEVPMVNSAATDPTIPETVIPWYFTVLQDDRVQSYTLARRIYSDLGLRRVAILRINDRYGRFGVGKFKDASRRLGHPVVIEQKYMYGDTDFARQLRVIQDSRVEAIVLWGDAGPAAAILKQMRAMGMKQRVFGSFRVLSDELLQAAGAAADGLEVVFPYDPSRRNSPEWSAFSGRYAKRHGSKPESFGALAYDAMRVLLDSICRAGLNRGLIRDALTGIERYSGVTGDMVFDPNCKNVAAMYLATVRDGAVTYRRYPMDKPYAQIGETPVTYNGPALARSPEGSRTVLIFGPGAEQAAFLGELQSTAPELVLRGINSEQAWGKASAEVVRTMQDPATVAVIATGRDAAHLAVQLASKIQLPVLALADDRSLTSANIPWIFRMPASTQPRQALELLRDAMRKAQPDREDIRRALASGTPVTGELRFDSTGEPQPLRSESSSRSH